MGDGLTLRDGDLVALLLGSVALAVALVRVGDSGAESDLWMVAHGVELTKVPPVVVAGAAIVTDEFGRRVGAVDLTGKGQDRWLNGIDQGQERIVVVAANEADVILLSARGTVVCLSRTGTRAAGNSSVLWRVPLAREWTDATDGDDDGESVEDGAIYMPSAGQNETVAVVGMSCLGHQLYVTVALDLGTGKILWTNRAHGVGEHPRGHHGEEASRRRVGATSNAEQEVEWHLAEQEEGMFESDRVPSFDDNEVSWTKFRRPVIDQLPHTWNDVHQSRVSVGRFGGGADDGAADAVIAHTPLGILVVRLSSGETWTHLPLEPHSAHDDFTRDGVIEHMFLHGHERCHLAAVSGMPFRAAALPTSRSLLFSRRVCRRPELHDYVPASESHYPPPVFYRSSTGVRAVVVLPAGRVLAVDATSGRDLWRLDSLGLRWDPEAGDVAVVTRTPGFLAVSTGAFATIVDVGGLRAGSRIVAQAATVALRRDGTVMRAKARWGPVVIDRDGDGAEDGVLVASGDGLGVLWIEGRGASGRGRGAGGVGVGVFWCVVVGSLSVVVLLARRAEEQRAQRARKAR